jgi:hypothetical protein
VTLLAEVVEGLRVTLDMIPDLRVYDHIPGTVNPPAAFIVPPTIIDYSDDFDDGSYVATFEVPVLVGTEDQKALFPFLDPRSTSSIYQAIMSTAAGRSLGGLNVDAWVTGSPRRVTFDEMAAYKSWGQVVIIMVSIS